MRLERGDRKGESGDVGDEMRLLYINPKPPWGAEGELYNTLLHGTKYV